MQLYVKIHLAYEYKYQNAKQLLYKTTIKKNLRFPYLFNIFKKPTYKVFWKICFICMQRILNETYAAVCFNRYD